jgi:hypothetical protein
MPMPLSPSERDNVALGRAPDRRLIAAAILCTVAAGVCLGSISLGYSHRNDELFVGVMLLGFVLHGLVALCTFGWARVSPAWLVVLLFTGCGSMAIPRASLNQACDVRVASACYLAERVDAGVAIDEVACGQHVTGTCERLVENDPTNATTHCHTWMKACRGAECTAASQHCQWRFEAEAEAAKTPLVRLKEKAEKGNVEDMNAYAWKLATSRNDEERNAEGAIYWARKVVSEERNVANYFDTLAAAYAEAGRWDDAVATQDHALEIALQSSDPRRAEFLAHYDTLKKREPIRE